MATQPDWTKNQPRDLPERYGWVGESKDDLQDPDGKALPPSWLVSKGNDFQWISRDKRGRWKHVANLKRSDYRDAQRAKKAFDWPALGGIPGSPKRGVSNPTYGSPKRGASKPRNLFRPPTPIKSGRPGRPKSKSVGPSSVFVPQPVATPISRRRRSKSPARSPSPVMMPAGARSRPSSAGSRSRASSTDSSSSSIDTRAARRAERAKVDYNLRFHASVEKKLGKAVYRNFPAPALPGVRSYVESLPRPGYGRPARLRSSLIWRRNQLEKTKNRWRKMMGWGISENIRIF